MSTPRTDALRRMATAFEVLRQIQDGAVLSSSPVSELLRRCQILATRVGLEEMGDWVRYELNGYPAEAELPSYRIVNGVARGVLHDIFGGGRVSGLILPAGNLPPELRDWARKGHLRQPIAELQAHAQADAENLHSTWPGDLVMQVRHAFNSQAVLVEAWLEIGRGQFVAVVENVRNRILWFALEAEGYVTPDDPPCPKEVAAGLSNVFHTHIYGGVGNVAQGSQDLTQISGIQPGDLSRLMNRLQALGIPPEDADKLAEAVEADGPLKDKRIGLRVANWMGSMMANAISGVGTVTKATATEVLPKLIKGYYGIGS